MKEAWEDTLDTVGAAFNGLLELLGILILIAILVVFWFIGAFLGGVLFGSIVWVITNIVQGGGVAYFPFMQTFVGVYIIIVGFIRLIILATTGK